ncbi:MAG TPA: hypothetical protein VHG53_00290 [Candidatus Limnocylindria bacterium]|nr:hypothetical protein [Candidatus Limnocylindria bacterium]
MPSEEGKQILRLLADGKVDAEQAYRLLRALGDVEERGAPTPPPRGARAQPPADPPIPPGLGRRTLRIIVTSAGKNKVNIAIPLAIARMGKTKIAASGLVREQLAKFGIDLDDVLRQVSHTGTIVDIAEGDDRVLINVE